MGDCLWHEWRELWFQVTGDSFIVDVRAVMGSEGAGNYLTKYLVKGVMNRYVLEALGFKRRFSASRNWPRGVVGVRGTEEGIWSGVSFVPGYAAGVEKLQLAAEASADDWRLERVGPELAVEMELKKKRKGTLKYVKGVLDANHGS